MLCEKCHKNEANVSVKTVVAGFTETHYLCTECSQKGGFFTPDLENFIIDSKGNILGQNIFSLSFDLDQLVNKRKIRQNLNNFTCPECGQNLQDFKETGLFGCPHCYSKFRKMIEPLLDEIHSRHQHLTNDNIPQSKSLTLEIVNDKDRNSDNNKIELDRLTGNPEIITLKKSLKTAIEAEDYEQAAVIRDQIKKIQLDFENKEKETEGEGE